MRSVDEKAKQLFKRLTKSLIIFVVFLGFMSSITFGGWIALKDIEEQTRFSMRNALQTVLRTTHEALYIWFKHRRDVLESYARSPEVVVLTKSLLELSENRALLADSESLKKIRDFFQPRLEEFDDQGIYIISPNSKNIATMRDINLGQINIIAQERPDILQKVLEGQIRLVPTIKSDIPLPDLSGRLIENYPTIFVVGPIRDEHNRIIAALAIRMDPKRYFNRIAKLGRIGESGETYAFDEDGVLITESRYDHQLRNLGLLKPNQSAMLSIRITDPGGNLLKGFRPSQSSTGAPLTLMARSATRGESSYDVHGYRDYRGVEVFGAWLWDEKLDLGLTTEIDADEALLPFYATRRILISVLFFSTLLALSLIMLLAAIRQKGEKNLKAAYNLLEERVRIRTSDLDAARRELSAANLELQNLATTDSLTNLPNRRNLDEFLEKEWNRCMREGHELSFAMIDIDSFKTFNDTYGHLSGDECLKRIGRILSTNRFLSRPGDLIARYGGEEFGVVLSKTSQKEALYLMEKICDAVRAEHIPHSKTCVEGENSVTVSIGLATMIPKKSDSPKRLIADADTALYQAKRNGRNRVEVFSENIENYPT